MEKLNFPSYEFRLRQESGQILIFDPFRKKYVVLNPEEWVRQHLARYLTEEKKVPAGLLSIEAAIRVASVHKRYDLVVFTNAGKPLLVAECKAAGIKVDQQVLDQALRYNIPLEAPLIVVTNGLSHYCFRLDREKSQFAPVNAIPAYQEMVSYV